MGIFNKNVIFFEHLNLFADFLILVLNQALDFAFKKVYHIVWIQHLGYGVLFWCLNVIPFIQNVVKQNALILGFLLCECNVTPQNSTLERAVFIPQQATLLT